LENRQEFHFHSGQKIPPKIFYCKRLHMNKRIKELMDKATTIDEYGWGASYENFDREKFAELIVRECAEICLEANDHKNILRHFGVEQDVNETLRNRSTYFGNDI
jgi:hypothetical protein